MNTNQNDNLGLNLTDKVMTGKELIIAFVITLVLVGLDLTGLPAGLIVDIHVSDVDAIIFTLIINQWFLIIIGLLLIRYLCPNLLLNFNGKGLKKGLKKYLSSALIVLVITTFGYYIGLKDNFNYKPSFEKVLLEGFIYYISVAILQEIYSRGLLLNIIERWFRKSNKATFIAIVISSALFSIGHIPGMIGQDVVTIILRLIWTMMLGIYLGIIYKKSNNLWVPIIAHFLINLCGLPFMFTTHREFPMVTVIIVAATYSLCSLWSIYDYFKSKNIKENHEATLSNVE